jgi:predicted nuclease with TOPRIM domain
MNYKYYFLNLIIKYIKITFINLMIGKKTGADKKETKETIQQERNMLKVTLEYLVKENENLKRQLEDMRVTVKSNKEQLKEYVERITNKDKVVEKMNNTIEQLQSRLFSLEEHVKVSQTNRDTPR